MKYSKRNEHAAEPLADRNAVRTVSGLVKGEGADDAVINS